MNHVARKSDLALWAKAKKKACTHGGLCKHSARKMQWATRYYKRKGGTYVGSADRENRLRRWGREKWRTSSGKKSAGKRRYLPDAAWKTLTPNEIRRTNDSKLKGYKRGKQWVRQPSDIAKKTRKHRLAHS